MSEKDMPLVSIVVPVYNGEKYLRQALDSLVNQTYPNIEIVVINNQSSDSSLQIAEEYEKNYPGMFQVYTIPFEKYPGGTKYWGYKYAKGEYIAECDSDDYMDYNAIQAMVDTALKTECEIVLGLVNEIDEITGKTITKGKIIPFTEENAILYGNAGFWANLIKKSFYDTHDPVNRDYVGDDSIYHYTVFPYAKIGYCNKVVYYYFKRISGSVHNIRKIENTKNLADTFDYIFHHLPTEHREVSIFLGVRWFVNNISFRFPCGHIFIEYLKRYKDLLEENKEYHIKKDKDSYTLANLYINLPDDPMPRNVYISGFGMTSAEVEERITSLKDKVYFEQPNMVVLDENNMDININCAVKKAYEDKNYDFVGKFFALKAIYENGGMFIGKRIRVDIPLDCLLYYRAVFCYLDYHNFTDEIFGGMAGQEVFQDILTTYQTDFYHDLSYPLAKRMKNILVCKYKVKMEGRNAIFKYPFSLFHPQVMVYEQEETVLSGSPMHLCCHELWEESGTDYLSVPRDIVKNRPAAPAATKQVSAKEKCYDGYIYRYRGLNNFQKFLILFLMDRNKCREKIRHRLRNHKILYRAAAFVNKSAKKMHFMKY